MGKAIRPVCKNCGHSQYHCPSSGCNFFDDNGWCECEDFEPAAQATASPYDLSGMKEYPGE